MMKASEILKVPLNNPELLFMRPTKLKQDFRTLAHIWHPDKPTGNHDVFEHISKLYENAVVKSDKGIWDNGAVISMSTVDGRLFRMPYKFKHEFDLGEYYVNDRTIVYLVRKKHKNYSITHFISKNRCSKQTALLKK